MLNKLKLKPCGPTTHVVGSSQSQSDGLPLDIDFVEEWNESTQMQEWTDAQPRDLVRGNADTVPETQLDLDPPTPPFSESDHLASRVSASFSVCSESQIQERVTTPPRRLRRLGAFDFGA